VHLNPTPPARTGPGWRGDENPTGMVVWWYDFLEHKIYTHLSVRTACFYVYAIERWLKPIAQVLVVQEIKILLVCWHTGTIFRKHRIRTLYIFRTACSDVYALECSSKRRNITMYSILIQTRKSCQCASIPEGFLSPLQRAVLSRQFR
jgi:hypothetical protein